MTIRTDDGEEVEVCVNNVNAKGIKVVEEINR